MFVTVQFLSFLKSGFEGLNRGFFSVAKPFEVRVLDLPFEIAFAFPCDVGLYEVEHEGQAEQYGEGNN